MDGKDVGFYNNLVHTLHFFIVTGKHGIIQNPTNFQFGKLDIKFIGFMVSIGGIRPALQIMDAIKKFPTTTNISKIRAWFGLV